MLHLQAGRLAAAVLVAAAFSLPGPAQTVENPPHPIVEVQTNVGSFCIELWPEKAPRTVNNFIKYVRSGFYEGTIFHRVIKGSVAQAGGFTSDLTPKPTRRPIPLETGGRNDRYTVAMARGQNPDTATSQFFINLVDNPRYDEIGYAVFGRVVKGRAVVDQIERSPVGRDPRGFINLPARAIVIEKVTILPPGERPA